MVRALNVSCPAPNLGCPVAPVRRKPILIAMQLPLRPLTKPELRKRKPSETQELLQLSRLDAAEACKSVGSLLAGLSVEGAEARLKRYGANVVTREHKPSIAKELWRRARNPLNALLVTLAAMSYTLGDVKAAVVVLVMVVLAIMTTFVQEHRSNEAAARLRCMVKTTVSARRLGVEPHGAFAEIPLETLVPATSSACRRGT